MPYQYAPIPIDGGLDFQSPKSMIPPGRLVDGLNYEIIDRTGVARIPGVRPFDGSSIAEEEEIYYLSADGAGSDLTTLTPGLLLNAEEPSVGLRDGPFGMLVGGWEDTDNDIFYIAYVRLRSADEPQVGDHVQALGITTINFYLENVLDKPRPLSDLQGAQAAWDVNYTKNFTSEALFSARNMCGYWARWLRLTSQDQSNNGPHAFLSFGETNSGSPTDLANHIVGLHWFNDRAYAVCDAHVTDIEWVAAATTLYAGDTLFVDSSPYRTIQILQLDILSGSFGAAGSARITYADVTNPISPATQLKYQPQSGLPAGTTTLKMTRKTAQSYTATVAARPFEARWALLYRSYSEAQAEEGDFVSSISISGGNAMFTTPPAVAITGGGGNGATAVAVISGNAGAASVVAVHVTNPGRGYTSTPTVTLSDSDGATTVPSATAVMSSWKDAGWKRQHTGWVVPFDAGTSAIGYFNTVDRARALGSQTTTYASTSTTGVPYQIVTGLRYPNAAQGALSWTPSTGSTLDSTLVQTSNNAGVQYLLTDSASSIGQTAPSIGFISLSNLAAQIPVGAAILGIEVTVTYDQSGGFTSATPITSYFMRGCLVKVGDLSDPSRSDSRLGNFLAANLTKATSSVSNSTAVMGGSNDLWGAPNLTFLDVRDPNFGVAVDLGLYYNSNAEFSYTFLIDLVEVKVYYSAPSVRLYASDGAGNTLGCELVDYVITGGSLESGDATGYLQVANLHQVSTTAAVATASHTIRNNYNIYTDPSLSAGSRIVTASADMTFNGLDSYAAITDSKSRYQFISANFYAVDDWDSIFGVSGAGRAFQFDGNYFRRIWKENPLVAPDADTVDRPRHIGKHKFRLALAYQSGRIAFSADGEPDNFSGVDGAVETGIGDRCTGLASLPGTYMVVFGENTITGIKEDTFEQSLIVPTAGAIEYTVASTGTNVLFANANGIGTLDQSEKYGDFVGNPLSYKVTPWLLPRLTNVGNTQSGQVAAGIVAAYVVRAKNQYRLWFQDGYQLVLSLVGPEREPQFTFVRYLLPDPQGVDVFMSGRFFPLALCSALDNTGKERILYSLDLPNARLEPDAISGAGDIPNYVYEAERFWGFSSYGAYLPIPAFVTFSHYMFEQPYFVHTLNKVRVEGLYRGIADLQVSVAKNYQVPDPSTPATGISLPPLERLESIGLPITFSAHSDMADVRIRDRVVTIRIDNYNVENQDDYSPNEDLICLGPISPQPPHYIQLLLTQFEPGQEDA